MTINYSQNYKKIDLPTKLSDMRTIYSKDIISSNSENKITTESENIDNGTKVVTTTLVCESIRNENLDLATNKFDIGYPDIASYVFCGEKLSTVYNLGQTQLSRSSTNDGYPYISYIDTIKASVNNSCYGNPGGTGGGGGSCSQLQIVCAPGETYDPSSCACVPVAICKPNACPETDPEPLPDLKNKIYGYAYYCHFNRNIPVPDIGDIPVSCYGGHVCNRTVFMPTINTNLGNIISNRRIYLNNDGVVVNPQYGVPGFSNLSPYDRSYTFEFDIPNMEMIDESNDPRIYLECQLGSGCHNGVVMIVLVGTRVSDNEKEIIFAGCLTPGQVFSKPLHSIECPEEELTPCDPPPPPPPPPGDAIYSCYDGVCLNQATVGYPGEGFYLNDPLCANECGSCETCSGEECCGQAWPQQTGFCCENAWRQPDTGVCCNGEWYPSDPEDPDYQEGECCDGVWQTGEGECCNNIWQTGEGGCCDNTWESGPGDCCLNTWYPEGSECPEGEIYLRWGPENACCGCLPVQIFDGRVQETVNTVDVINDLCCPGCDGPLLPYSALDGSYIGCASRCCNEGICTNMSPFDCTLSGGVVLSGCCDIGCPTPCCSESSNGNVTCETTDNCDAPSIEVENCETGCLGECCINGVSQGQTTQEACDALNGLWAGLGSTECQNIDECRSPFDEGCCESKQSSGSSLTFTQPRNKRTPPFSDTFRVTVTGFTDSAVLVHGTLFGVNSNPPERCPINHSFLLCWDEFHIEPATCDTNMTNVDVTVCWEEESVSTEVLAFSGCDGPEINLGYCPYNCQTELLYSGNGHTTDRNIVLRSDATITANGTGPLVLTSPIITYGSCVETLIINGTSTQSNRITSIGNSASGLTVLKDGSGLWRIAGNCSYSGQLQVLNGTIVIASNVPSTGPSPFGVSTSNSLLPLLDGSADVSLFGDNVTISRGFSVSTGGGNVTIGSVGTSPSIFANGISIRLGSDVTLQSPSGGSVIFANAWQNYDGTGYPISSITVGSPGNNGDVSIEAYLGDLLGGVTVVTGTLLLGGDNDYSSGTVINGGQAVAGSLTAFGTGSITINSGGTLNKNGFAIANTIINNGGTVIN